MPENRTELPSPPGSDTGTIQVMAHYVSWHRECIVWEEEAPIQPIRNSGVCDVGYDSRDPEIIRQQNEEFLENDIVPLASWWGKAGSRLERSGDLFLDAYLSVPSPVRIGILYEMTELLIKSDDGKFDFNNPENVERFASDIEYLNTKYFSKYPDRFYRIDGKPVVFVWLTGLFKGPFHIAAEQARARANVYLIGSDFNIFSYFRTELLDTVKGFDAVSSYGIYSPDLARTQSEIDEQYLGKYVQSALRWAQWLEDNAPRVVLIPPMMFAYDDTMTRPEAGNLPITSSHEIAVLQARTVQSLIHDSLERCGNIVPYVIFVSYNEHYEGTSLEPTDRYGDSYLRIVGDVFTEPVPAPLVCN